MFGRHQPPKHYKVKTFREQVMSLQVEIRLKGRINPQWSEWFGGLNISHSGPDETILSGVVPDQAALYGIISRLRDLGLELSSLNTQTITENSHERKC
jgi:hypothetical protein